VHDLGFRKKIAWWEPEFLKYPVFYVKKTAMTELSNRFTKAQLELLKMFSRDIPEEQWVELRRLIFQYFHAKSRGMPQIKPPKAGSRKILTGCCIPTTALHTTPRTDSYV
jgi:hypothetical protein